MTAWTLWITGLPGSGKSTLTHALHSKAREQGVLSQILATDNLRKVMTPTSTYSEHERSRVYATIIYIAALLNKNGVNSIIDATGNRRRYRQVARKTLQNFVLIYAKCSLDICINREQKRGFAYEAPEKPSGLWI